MTRIAFKNAWARKRRLVGTFLAVFLGVSFLSGMLVLGQTLQRNFDGLFADANAGTDAVVRSQTKIDTNADFERGPIDASTVKRVRAVAGVASVVPYVEGYGQLLDKHGEAIGGNGPPRVAASWIPDRDLNAYRLVKGRPPRAGNEVVINRGAAKSGHLAVGDSTIVQTPRAVRVRIVGIATFASADGFGESTYTAFTLSAAQRHVLGRSDRISNLRVTAAPGVSQDQLVARLQRTLPRGTQAITGARLTKEKHRRHQRPVPGAAARLPARLRRDRAARRGVQHLQHALDPGRPAHARVRAPPSARSVPPPGTRGTARRVAAHRRGRLARGARRWGGDRVGAQGPVQRVLSRSLEDAFRFGWRAGRPLRRPGQGLLRARSS